MSSVVVNLDNFVLSEIKRHVCEELATFLGVDINNIEEVLHESVSFNKIVYNSVDKKSESLKSLILSKFPNEKNLVSIHAYISQGQLTCQQTYVQPPEVNIGDLADLI